MSERIPDKSLLQLIHEMNVAVLDTDASGRPAAHLWSAWCALSELLPRWDKLNKMVDGLGEAPPSAIAPNVIELLRVAQCPACDGSGAIPHQIGEGDWELQQCQWCDERQQAIGPSDGEAAK